MCKRPSNAGGMFNLLCRTFYWKRPALCSHVVRRPQAHVKFFARRALVFPDEAVPGWSSSACPALHRSGSLMVAGLLSKRPRNAALCPSFAKSIPCLTWRGLDLGMCQNGNALVSLFQYKQSKLMVGEVSSLSQAHMQAASCMAKACRSLSQQVMQKRRVSHGPRKQIHRKRGKLPSQLLLRKEKTALAHGRPNLIRCKEGF